MKEKIYIIMNISTNHIISIHKTKEGALIKLDEFYEKLKPYYEKNRYRKIEYNKNDIENPYISTKEELDWGDEEYSVYRIEEYEMNE